MNGEIAMTKPANEMGNADGQVQNARFHEDADNELEPFRGGVVFVSV
jgi:hypothetical protein